MNRRQLVILAWLLFAVPALLAQNPQSSWQQFTNPEDAGFSSQGLAEAQVYYDSLDAAAFMAVVDGRVLMAWGDMARRYMCHSVRKSFLSALYGIYVREGVIDPDKTLADLNIDDKDRLTDAEKRATVRDLLKARSGVYHPAAYETPGMKRSRPERSAHAPNTFWYYNNWDFNTLGFIFEQETGVDIFAAFEERIAGPLQMEDFRVTDGYHHQEAEHSIYPAYPFRMSTRDMARFGLLFARQGRWNGEQIIAKEWVEESTTSYSEANEGGYGYMWWIEGPVSAPGMYFALGAGGHVIGVAPAEDLVFVMRVNTYAGQRVRLKQTLKLVELIRQARFGEPNPSAKLTALKNQRKPPGVSELTPQELAKYTGEFALRERTIIVKEFENGLLVDDPSFGKFRLFPITKTKFLMEDSEQFLIFEFSEERALRLTRHQSEPVADLYDRIVREGVANGIAHFRSVNNRNGFRFRESEINGLGYEFLGSGRVAEAIEIFKLNVQTFPEAFNTYDSLGEAYMAAGQYELAIESYKKSLQINPQNLNAEQMLKRIQKQMTSATTQE